MRFLKTLIKLIITVTLLPYLAVAHAETIDMTADFASDFTQHYNKFHTLGEFLERAPLRLSDYAFLIGKASGLENEVLPKMSHYGSTMQFELGRAYTFELIPSMQGHVAINHRIVDFSKVKTAHEAWELVNSALEGKKTSRWMWALPEAQAILFLIPIILTAMSVAVAAGGVLMSIHSANQKNCMEISKAGANCIAQLQEITIFVRRQAANVANLDNSGGSTHATDSESSRVNAGEAQMWKTVAAQVKAGDCNYTDPNINLDKETQRVLFDAWSTPKNAAPQLWSCPDSTKTNKEIYTCIQRIEYIAKNICFGITAETVEDYNMLSSKPDVDLKVTSEGIVPWDHRTPPVAPVSRITDSIKKIVATPPADLPAPPQNSSK